MEFLDKSATIIFIKLLDGLKGGEYRKIENEPFMRLTIEQVGQGIQTPWGRANLYSLCHYYEQEGDLMQDPEMCFIVTDERAGFAADYDKVKIAPYIFRQANMGIYAQSVFIENYTVTKFKREQQKEQADFANGWLVNIQSQGFLKYLP